MRFFKKIPFAFYILGCYTILSGYFALERILNSDNSYYLFQVLNYKHFWLPEYRWSDVFSQIPLLVFTQLNASLHFLIYTYSLTFPLEYIVIAAVCEYFLKVKEAALTLALALITGVAYSFFHPVTETYQALAFGILLYATIVSERLRFNTILYYLSIAGISLVCFVSHPIGVFVIAFVALFAFVSRQVKLRPFLFIAGLSVIAVLLRLKLTPARTYDTQQYDTLFNSLESLNNFGNFYPFVFLKNHLLDLYIPVILLLAAFCFIAVRSKQITIAAVSITCSIGFAIIGILTFAKGDLDMMMEKTFMPSIFMVLLPFCFVAYRQSFLPPKTLNIFLLIISFISFMQIRNVSAIVTERLSLLTRIAATSTHPKLLADLNDFPEPAMHFNYWNTALDSYFIAKCTLNKDFTLFLALDKKSFKFDPADSALFLANPWHPYQDKKMVNETYFHLPAVGYRLYKEY